MTYKKFIKNIKAERGMRKIDGEYMELHHIIPRCMGGDNSCENVVWLTGREHIIAHKLLHEENPNNSKLTHAYWMMAHIRKDKHECTPEEYECAKAAHSKAISGKNNPLFNVRRYGEQNGMYGRKHTDETKLRMRKAHYDASGTNNPRAKAVVQMTTDGKRIKEWACAKFAADELGVSQQHIANCCRGSRKTTGGFSWKYAERS